MSTPRQCPSAGINTYEFHDPTWREAEALVLDHFRGKGAVVDVREAGWAQCLASVRNCFLS